MTARERSLQLVASLPGVTLAELDARAELTTRHDRKYLATWPQVHTVLEALATDHGALDIDGRRTFTYDTLYFDSGDLAAFRAHVQGRRRRYKVRLRSYVDADLHVLELKLKGRRGETIKHRSRCGDVRDPLSPDAVEFLDERLQAAYGMRLPAGLTPVLRTRYERLTLVRHDGGSRLTCDWHLGYPGPGAAGPALSPGRVILELKAASSRSPAAAAFRALNLRPVELSKYVLGVGLCDLAPIPNALRRTARDLLTDPEPHPHGR